MRGTLQQSTPRGAFGPARGAARRASRVIALALFASGVGASAPAAAQTEMMMAPTHVDTVHRGLRLRTDIGGRYNTIGLPDPPVRLEVDDVVNDQDDIDVYGLVIMGLDRPGNVPIAFDLMGDIMADLNGDSPVSPFLDSYSLFPQAHLYSAFVGLSGVPGEALEPYKLNIGRMTELVDSPITYDGLSAGANWKFRKLGWLSAKVWGGIDAPQWIATDPFTRIDRKAYEEAYVDASGFISGTGGLEIQRNAFDLDDDGNVDPNLNIVGGLAVEGRFAGFGFVVNHTLLPTVQRSRTGLSYAWDSDLLSFMVGADLRWSDFLPRNTIVRGDLLSGDGTTRVGMKANLQFLEDVCAYDCTFRAFNPAQQINQVADGGVVIDNNQVELLRVRDQIRHLNIGPAQEHVAAMLDVERQLPFGFSVLARGRMRQHFDQADVDYFRSDLYEAAIGGSFSTGFAIDVGTEVAAGFLNTGEQNNLAFDLFAEGLRNYVENRTWLRTVLLEGRLSNLAEVFVRRHDIETKALLASGQYSGAFANSTRYDVLEFWSVGVRFEADLLSPVDTLNGSGYLAALANTSLRF